MKNNYLKLQYGIRTIIGICTVEIWLLLLGCSKENPIIQKGEINWLPISHTTCIKPADLQVFTSETHDIVITWRESPTAYEYRVINTQYLNNPSASATDITLYTTKNSVVLKNLTPKTTYTFRISSVCHEDATTPWEEISFTTSE